MSHYLANILSSELGMGLLPAQVLPSLTRSAKLDGLVYIAIRAVIVGFAVAGLRKLVFWTGTKVGRALFPTAYIAVHDASYLWVMAWIAQDPAAQKQIRDFQLSTSEWRQVRQGSSNALAANATAGGPKGGNIGAASAGVGEQNATWSSKEIIGQVIPTYHHSVLLKHEGSWLWVTRKMNFFARTSLRTVDHIQIRTVAFQPDAIKNFLSAAHQQYFVKQEKELLIFHAQRINPIWQKPVSRPSRPWPSVILPGAMKDELLMDVEKFLSEKEVSWYAARGIPHRRGYLFHGAPGAGKTTLATAIASKLRLDIYVINPAQRGMDDAKLSKLFRDCPARSVILIEDIDCVFPRGPRTLALGVQENGSDDAVDMAAEPEPVTAISPGHVGGQHDLAPSTVTLSGLLNAIDGVSSQEGCILIASTNHPKRLDPALSRAGRFDVQIAFTCAIPSQARSLFLHFYPLSDFAADSARATTIADSTSEKLATLSLTGARSSGIASQAELDTLADHFVNAIFPTGDGKKVGKDGLDVSMAALQGYLLGFKEDPRAAVDGAAEWVAGLEPKKKQQSKTKGGAKADKDTTPLTPTSAV